MNAGHRMLQRLRDDYPLAIIVSLLQPFVEQLRAARFSFLLVAKPGDTNRVAVLRRGNLLDGTAANAASTSGSPSLRQARLR